MTACRTCGEDKPPEAFYSYAAPGYTADRPCVMKVCKVCHAARCKTRERANRLPNLYGITESQYDAMREAQGDRCAVCADTFTTATGKGHPHVDHDHRCCPGRKSCGKCVRGLLCHRCNTALGLLKDDLGTLTAAMAYLVRTENVLAMPADEEMLR